jgi:DNA-binding response OmpR family regulator
MNTDRREQIRRSLCSLAESYAATMELMERTLSLLCEELALDPWTYFQTHPSSRSVPSDRHGLVVDHKLLSVHFDGKTCFLGNTLSFRFLARLSERPNAYVSYEELLSDVWQGVRSDAAVRSTVKTLRQRLRKAGMGGLADAIDGKVPGHYTLKVASE